MGKMKQLQLNEAEQEEHGYIIPMQTPFEQVGEFHRTMNHLVYEPTVDRGVPDTKVIRLRLKLITEELLELMQGLLTTQSAMSFEGMFENLDAAIDKIVEQDIDFDIVEVADALGDINYVVNGAAHAFNFDLDAVTDEIHKSNMSKLGPDGFPIWNEAGKVQKGPNYFKPNIRKVLDSNKLNGV